MRTFLGRQTKETNTMKHTPTPWKLSLIEKEGLSNVCIVDSKLTPIAKIKIVGDCLDNYNANAEHIIKAVNSHEYLIECLKDVLADLESGRLNHVDGNEACIDQIKENLKLAVEL